MADYSSGIVEAPVNLPGVSDLIEAGTYELGELCNSSKINKFSPIKPVNHKKYSPLTDTDFDGVDYGVSFSVNHFTPRIAAQMAALGELPDSASTEYEGGIQLTDMLRYEERKAPYRLSDFDGYNHNAETSIWGVELDATHYKFYNNGNYNPQKFGDTVGIAEYQHIGLLITKGQTVQDADTGEDVYVPSEIAIVAGGEEVSTQFGGYIFGNTILNLSDIISTSESDPDTYVLPILCKCERGKISSGDVETASSAIPIDEDSWDKKGDDLGDNDFIVLPLKRFSFHYTAPALDATLTWGTIEKVTDLLSNYVKFNLIYSGNTSISKVTISIYYHYYTEPEQTIVHPIEKTGITGNIENELDLYEGTPDSARLVCSYTVGKVEKILNETSISLLNS